MCRHVPGPSCHSVTVYYICTEFSPPDATVTLNTAGSNTVLLQLGSQDIAHIHVQGITKKCVIQVLMIVQCNLKYLLMKIIACTCYMHITVQCSIGHKKNILKVCIAPHTLSLYSLSKPHLPLLGNGVNQEVCPNIVNIGYQDGAVLWGEFRGINVFLHSGAPVDPPTWKKNKYACIKKINHCVETDTI